jgi:O-antigen/teichoic acid export membrane protein
LLSRKSFLILSTRLLAQILSFVGLFFITRYMGATTYGNVAWTMALVASINSIADLGFGSAHIKRLSEGNDVNECISTYAIIKLSLTAIMVTVTLVGFFIYTNVLALGVRDTSWDLIILFVIYYAFYDLAAIAIVSFDGMLQTAKSQIISLVDPLIRLPLVILFAVSRMGPFELGLAYAFGAMGLLIAALVLLYKQGIVWQKPVLFHKYLVFAIPFMVISIVGAIYSNVDRIVLGFFGTSVDVAYYSSAVALMAMLNVVGAAIATVTFPAFSQMYKEGRFDEIRKKTREAERYTSMLVVPVVVVIIIFPYDVAKILFGGNFELAGGALRWIVVATYLTLLNQAYSQQLISLSRLDLYFKVIIISMIGFVVLLLVLVPGSVLGIRLGGMLFVGAAFASLGAAVISFVLTRHYVRNLTKTTSNPRILKHILAGTISGVLLWYLSEFIALLHWYDLVLFGIIEIATFLSVLALIKEFTKDDLNYLLDVVNLRKMGKYIKEELGR